jgi:ATP-dependent DNA ligase
MPRFIEFSDPRLQEHAPVGHNWVYEIKTDGYRAQVHVRNGRVTIYPAAARTGPGNLQQLPKQRRA